MPVRAPTPHINTSGTSRPVDSNDLSKALVSLGLMKPGQNPNKVLAKLLKNLVLKGFSSGAQKNLSAQTQKALRQLQKTAGLKVTGQLDKATTSVLKQMGIITAKGRIADPKKMAQAQQRGRDNFDPRANAKLAKTQAKTGAQQASNMPVQSAGPEGKNVLSLLTNILSGSLDGSSKPADKQAAEHVEGGDTVSEDGGGTKGNQGEGKEGAKANTNKSTDGKAAQQARADGRAGGGAEQGPTATQSSALEQQRAASQTAQQDPTGKGVPEGKGDPNTKSGRSKKKGKKGKKGEGEAADGGLVDAEGSDGSGTEEEDNATEQDTGNAPSGEELSEDRKRGHSTLDDDSKDQQGYYKIPPLIEQMQQSLTTINRDPPSANKATTYSWDVTLYRPAVYGAKQQAEQIFHLVVDSATAFDPVWERARIALENHLRKLEPDATPLSEQDFLKALQQARYQEPSR